MILTRELRARVRASCRYDVENGTRSLARLVDSCKLFFDFRLLSAFDSFWRVVNKRNGDLVTKNSGGVKKKPMIILKEFIFFRFSFNKWRQQLAGVRGFTLK